MSKSQSAIENYSSRATVVKPEDKFFFKRSGLRHSTRIHVLDEKISDRAWTSKCGEKVILDSGGDSFVRPTHDDIESDRICKRCKWFVNKRRLGAEARLV